MNSKERIKAAMNHSETDKVPVDMNATIVTSLTRIAYENLREYLGLPSDPDITVSHFAMDTVRAKEDLLNIYGVDTRSVSLMSSDRSTARYLANGNFVDDYGIEWQKASFYWDVVGRPFEFKSIDQIDGLQWIDEDDPGLYRGLREAVLKMMSETDKALVFDIPGLGPFEGSCFLRNYDKFCVDLYTDEKYAEKVLDKVTDSIIRIWENILNEVGDLVDIVAQGDDVGMQNSPFMSVEMYRKFIKPRQKRIFDCIHSKSNAKIFYHSCGSVYAFIPDFIENGVDILNPIQRNAAEMDISRLKKEFGKELCFWGGGIDVQDELPFMNSLEIRDEVHRTLDIMMPGGGYVFFPSHNIQADVPPENIDAVFNAVMEYR